MERRRSVGLAWFRRDLRLHDNPAWAAATNRHDRVIPLFVIDPAIFRPGQPRSTLLLHHLGALDRSLRERGGRLLVRVGDPRLEVPAVAHTMGAHSVSWNRDVSPYSVRRDMAVESALEVVTDTWWGSLVHAPSAIHTKEGKPYRVFTPFHAAWQATPWSIEPEASDTEVHDDPGAGLPTPPNPASNEPGERAAGERLRAFVEAAAAYGAHRDFPALEATSRLSSDLTFGTLSPRRVARAVGALAPEAVRQLAWRDFHAHVLHSNPHAVDTELDPRYRAIAWRADDEGFSAWRAGQTGYPIVDAGMRQLRSEGWMHGRVRMITSSFLVKDLLIDWRRGERWFRSKLLDGDVAQNVGNWQWVAGTGVDAAPWFRVFNPVLQGQRFDPEGAYIKRWVPELRHLGPRQIHEPWKVQHPGSHLYPAPIVDHAAARDEAIAAYTAARSA
jgi:deoxyribodipyrimidine photo-lyase